MKASIRRNYCSPSQLRIEQIEKPIPKDNEVLIKVSTTTVNRTDCANLTAKPFIMRFVLGVFKPRKITVGTDFAGEVISIGKNVNSTRIGDRVFGFNDTGAESQAEYLATTEKNIFGIPKNIDFKLAAASLEGAHYAYSFIHKVNIEIGHSILIIGATGGIGSALLQFVRQYDVKITATCNTKNLELIKSLGADKILMHLTDGVPKKRVGFLVEGRAPVREGAEIADNDGNIVGVITSGGFGPTLQAPVAMGYVSTALATVGTQLNAIVRGKHRPMTVTKMPLVPQRYHRG